MGPTSIRCCEFQTQTILEHNGRRIVECEDSHPSSTGAMKRIHRFFAALAAAALLVIPVAAQEAPLGSEMPLADRSMTLVDGSSTTLGSLQGDAATVVVFWSNQCPWVDRYEERMQAIMSDYSGRGVSFALVNANDPDAYPKESIEESRQRAQSSNYSGRYVIDTGSQLANALGATRTPHVYVFNQQNRLVYVGSIDDSPGDPGNVQRTYLRDALDAVIADRTVSVPQTKAFGCTIRFNQ